MAGGVYQVQALINSARKMALSLNQVREVANKSPKKTVISKAIAHQNRINFHAQTRLTDNVVLPAVDFLTWVENILSREKYQLFKQLFRYPIITNEVTGTIFEKLFKIFDGRNPVHNYQFKSTEEREDWERYRREVLKEPIVWETTGWEHFKSEINSVLVCDLPIEQPPGDKYPSPYFYWLTIDNVICFDADPQTGVMKYIMFRQPDDIICVIDDESYRLFQSKGNGNEIGALLVENKHDLGYCPARFFWDEPLSLKMPDVKKSPLTKQLEKLDWYLFFAISKRNLDLMGAYPVMWGYEPECGYLDPETGVSCDHGILRDGKGRYKYDRNGILERCPKCKDSRIIGAGTMVFMPPPRPGDEKVDMKDPVGMLRVDKDSLDYNVDEDKRLREAIIDATVGRDSEIVSNQAVNEKQVGATFESKNTILFKTKKGFESAQKFVDETCARLRYGTDRFISAEVDYGTEFYIMSATELREKYRLAKEDGASEAELDALHQRIIETEYRNDKMQMQKMKILMDLEPYRHLTRQEVIDMYDKGLATRNELYIKLNFASLISRFERENINVLDFGIVIPYENKINIITDKLNEYANSSIKQVE